MRTNIGGWYEKECVDLGRAFLSNTDVVRRELWGNCGSLYTRIQRMCSGENCLTMTATCTGEGNVCGFFGTFKPCCGGQAETLVPPPECNGFFTAPSSDARLLDPQLRDIQTMFRAGGCDPAQANRFQKWLNDKLGTSHNAGL